MRRDENEILTRVAPETAPPKLPDNLVLPRK